MRLNHVTLLCADVGRSLAFYEGLGLQAIVVEPGEGDRHRHARLRFPDGDATLSLEDAPREVVAAAAGAGPRLFFECPDLDARVAALAAAGYAVAATPESKPWLWREAELRDPDGHRLCLYWAGSYRVDPPGRLPGSPDAGAVERGAGAGDAEAAAEAEIAPFASARNRGYVDVPIPSARDEQLAAYLEGLIARGPEARERAAARLGPAYTDTLLAFAERMATRAVRDRRPRSALLGLVAVALAWREAPDVRAAVPLLALLYDAARRTGGDPAAAFDEARGLAPADVAPVFQDFLTRPDLDEVAEEMGFGPGSDRDGFRYRRFWGTGRLDPG